MSEEFTTFILKVVNCIFIPFSVHFKIEFPQNIILHIGQPPTFCLKKE